jgi:hypothetical protein
VAASGGAVSDIFQWFPLLGGVDGRRAVAPCCPPFRYLSR